MYVVDLHSRMKLCQINLFFHFLFFLLLPFKLFLLYDLDLAAAAAERWHPGMYPRVFSSRGPPPRRLGFVASSRQSSSRAPFPRREIFSPFLRGLLSVVKTFFLVSFLFFRVLFITFLDFFFGVREDVSLSSWGSTFEPPRPRGYTRLGLITWEFFLCSVLRFADMAALSQFKAYI